MSQWGLSFDQAVSLSTGRVNRLLGAYIERKRFESKMLLAELGKALSGDKGNQLSSLSVLSSMGIGIEGA